MRLEEYWGIGPKTSELLTEELGVERAIEAIESADTRALTTAGLSRGRATRILRRATGAESMDLLATRDTRDVYKELLDLAEEYAVTEDAADSIRVLTPLPTREAMDERLDDVLEARDTWADLSEADQRAVLDAFDAFDADGGELAAVDVALALRDTGIESGVFEPLATLDGESLTAGRAALAGLAGDGESVGEGADEELDRLRDQLGQIEDLAAASMEVVEAVQEGARRPDEFQDALVRHVTGETGIDAARVRDAMPREATDARDFVDVALRELRSTLRSDVREREGTVADRLEDDLADARGDIDAAIEAVDDIAFSVSLARFAIAFDLTRPAFVEDRKTIAVKRARNLTIADVESVQPVTYAIGDHTLDLDRANQPPSGDRVAVLTGANSGGKTTLLETLCQVQLLAQMGLPVPAEAAEVGIVDTVVFHRRHASFNAGVLESTLRSVVPPLTESDRTLMLVDEFEAITEPGSAADLLHGLVTLTVDRDALGVFVTHLADDLEPLPVEARVDGIFAEGLNQDLELQVDYQPRFGTVGKSTPEFIVSRLVANAKDPVERNGFETLATAVGEEAVQRTLSDALWTDE
ncbi:DNA mismatch repair protein [Haloarcula sp. CBA1115]|uniref:MutS-related protein n=1 Tax=unclassified Haloarcula TaxID=2624677 RepID=UPI0005955624|nr:MULTISPECIES: DNA mismatch repair protein [unclassified Haloarcula]AJF27245.1 DNA mismatch repair protein [Haloarcula sp. CBA1115]KAA9406945.1 DNA mismatch repair protein [Haloarcula sp. CBA1131]